MNSADTSLNKYISSTGFCSRREADKLIEQERVTVNGKIALSGNRVKEGDIVKVDGEPLKSKPKSIYIAFHKPVGISSTTDPKDKYNIIDYIKFPQRIFPIGRLDKDSEGLIFLTNDGDIVNKILRAGNDHQKEYVVTVDKPVTPDFIKSMSSGVRILETVTQKCTVKQSGKFVFTIILTQGLNRQIRRMCSALGYQVKRLIRVRIMNIQLTGISTGKWRYLTEGEISEIQLLVKNSVKTKEASELPANKKRRFN
ncbi:hypothetical protein BH09BAC2_BH09BAC2_09800 [soil metagenome]